MGATGRLGRLIIEAVITCPETSLVAALTHAASSSLGDTLVGTDCRIEVLSAAALTNTDVIIDASLPGGLSALLALGGTTPIVSGATGCDDDLRDRIEAVSAHRPILHAANFTAGVALLSKLAAVAALALPDYQVTLTETHHVHKLDAPSGTALLLADSVAAVRGVSRDTLAIQSHRLGEVVGEHTLSLVGPTERIELAHIATDRSAFASGALRAARYLVHQPSGRYTMTDVLGLD